MDNQIKFLKLRKNISLDGDVDLAEREIRTFFENVERVSNPETVESKIGLPVEYAYANSRGNGCIGFLANKTSLTSIELVSLLNFIQEIWFENNLDNESNFFVNPLSWSNSINNGAKDFVCLVPFMASSELLSQNNITEPDINNISRLTAFLSGNEDNKQKLIKAPTSGGTSTQHVHSLHKYKAKFFPRLIRSFLVQYLGSLPRDKNNKVILLDPFVGSGTALVEATLLGIDSVGVDVDKLSCAISESKISALSIDPDRIVRSLNVLNNTLTQSSNYQIGYKFPKCIDRKFERWGSLDEQYQYEQIISKWLHAINGIEDKDVKSLFLICLSDAITRKFVIRMMGTGVGRFALEIAKTSLDKLMEKNLKSLINSCNVAQSLIGAYNISLGQSTIYNGTAINMPFDNNSFSVNLTSPPYLPASSGREDYLVSKAISSVALNLMTDDEIESAEKDSVGSMKWAIENGDGLPKAVYDLHDWLLNDPLRKIKAKPILAYYMSLKQALKESYRVLMNNGLAFYIIGKESIFYNFRSREVLYRVECDKIFADLAMSVGFTIEDKINIELDKKNMNARPRSLDSFYETVFILKKNQNF